MLKQNVEAFVGQILAPEKHDGEVGLFAFADLVLWRREERARARRRVQDDWREGLELPVKVVVVGFRVGGILRAGPGVGCRS